jgi:hypothetical protein
VTLRDSQEFFLRLCRGEDFNEDPDADYVLEQGRERLLVYRRLVVNSVAKILEMALPIFCDRLGSEGFRGVVHKFVAHGIRSNIYRKIPEEFVAFLNLGTVSVELSLMEIADYEFRKYELIFRKNALLP